MNIVFQLLLVTLLFASMNTNAAQEDSLCKMYCSHRASAENLLYDFRNFAQSRELTGDYDVKYHRLEWEVDPTKLYINGTVTTYFESEADGLTDLFFDFSDSLDVINVIYHGNNVTTSQPGNNLLKINLLTDISKGDLDSITVIYEGRPFSSGLGSFKVGVHGPTGEPVLWTLSEPYGSRDWWPCKHDLNDKIDSIDVIVTTPSKYKTASNGLLISETTVGTQKIMHWKHRYKIPAYLIAIAVAEYNVFEHVVYLESGDSVVVMNMVYQEKLDSWLNATASTTKYMKYFSEKLGIYPFHKEKYGHASFSAGGGMEHQTMSFMGGASKGLIAHELVHQWFGNKITCGSWADLWLNEGFATYFTELTIEYFEPWQKWQDHKENYNTSVTSLREGSVFIPDTTNVGRMFSTRLTYQKASIVLRMLRWKIGDIAFFKGVYNYINDPNLVYAYAQTDDFIGHMEAAANEDLTTFFNDWIYGEGFPAYGIQAFQDGNQLRISAFQSTTHPSVDFFEMPIPIYCSGAGRDTLYRLNHTEDGQYFELEIPFKIDSIAFDPTYYLLSANNKVTFNRKKNFIEFYPNPTSNNIFINSSDLVTEILIFSTDGKIIYQSNEEFIGTSISMESFASGIYLVKATSNAREEVFRIVKQ